MIILEDKSEHFKHINQYTIVDVLLGFEEDTQSLTENLRFTPGSIVLFVVGIK